MLHSKKCQSILQWFNALTAKGDVNSLEQFTDGSYFYEIVASLQPFHLQGSRVGNLAGESVIFSETSIACNEEVITSVEDEPSEGKVEASVSGSMNTDPFVVKESDHTDTHKKYDVIKKFIDDFYHIESFSLIDYGQCQKGKELELAKVAVFLLSAMVQNLLSSGDKVVFNTTLLDPEVQANIFECLALLFGEKDMGENEIKKSELHKVLSRAANYKGTPLRKQPSRSIPDSNDLSEVKNVHKKRKERTSVIVYEDLQDSPLKNLLESPKIQYKAAIFKKESELAKLRSALHSEENKVMDLTLEKQNLNNELEKKKNELEFYKKELKSQREALSEKEEQENLKAEEWKNKQIEAERVRKLIESQEEEIKKLKENNEALQENVVEIEKKLEQDATTSLVKENNSLKEKIQILELDNEKKAESIKILNEKIASFENDLVKYQQMFQDISAPISRRELIGSPNVHETISTIIYADELTSRETLERKEQELKQDMETKDERIKRLAHKGETFRNKNPNMESLQMMVDRLRGRVDSLEKEKNILKKNLENYKSVVENNGSGVSNSTINESDRIGLATNDVPEISSNKGEESSLSARLQYDTLKLTEIIRKIRKKNWLSATVANALMERHKNLRDKHEVSACLRDLLLALTLPTKPSTRSSERERVEKGEEDLVTKSCTLGQENLNLLTLPTKPSTRSSERERVEKGEEDLVTKCCTLGQENLNLKNRIKSLEKSCKRENELMMAIKTLKTSNADLMKKNENLRQEVAIAEEKYVNMEKLAKKKDDDVKKALIMYQKIVKLDKKEKDSKKECSAECEKIRRKCKQLNEQCLDFDREAAELRRSIKNLEGMMEHLRFEIRELKKEKEELKQKLWEETSALSKNTADRDALVLHYLKKSKHEPKNKDLELRKEEHKKSSRPIVKVDAYILNAENEPSTSNSVLASRSIRSSFFQVADEDDFLNESSLAEIHNGGIQEGETGENRLLELQRRNTLCPPHLQSSYPLEIQDMTPSERKYYYPGEVSFDMSRKSSYKEKRDIHKNPKSKCMESDSDDSDEFNSFPVKKRKISEKDPISVPVFKKQYRPSNCMAKGQTRDQGNLRKPSTPLKRVAAFVKRQSASFKTPSSVNRLMKLPRKSKMY